MGATWDAVILVAAMGQVFKSRLWKSVRRAHLRVFGLICTVLLG